MTALPLWYPWRETETKPAPMPLLLVQGFLNTLDVEDDVDLLADAEATKAWLLSAGLLDDSARVSPAGAALAREMRESIRDLLDAGSADLTPVREVAGTASARLAVDDQGTLRLEHPPGETVKDALFQLLLIIRTAQEDRTWSRLRVCANDGCRWSFYDRSRNQQGQWCDMAVCGNRLKNREFRARRRG
jgi:predicted RNA-binding Zn ribbon-like protein